MNLGLESTVRKFFAVTASDGGGSAAACALGSRKKSRTKKTMAKTLRAAMRKTFSTPNFACAQSAITGPRAPPIFHLLHHGQYRRPPRPRDPRLGARKISPGKCLSHRRPQPLCHCLFRPALFPET